jgi:hypothetical protein
MKKPSVIGIDPIDRNIKENITLNIKLLKKLKRMKLNIKEHSLYLLSYIDII